MTDREILASNGYSYNPMSGSWLKVDGRMKSMLAIYGFGDGVFLAVKSVGDKTAKRTRHVTVSEAVEAGEAWLAEMAKGEGEAK